MFRATIQRLAGPANNAPTKPQAPFRAVNTAVTLSTKPVVMPPLNTLQFGRKFSHHMLVCDWTRREGGWGQPKIVPLQDFSMHPATSVLHYAIECFEGLKAYKDASGGLRLFRPDMNGRRLRTSTARLALPDIEVSEFVEALKLLVRIEKDWIPQEKGYSLYIRPTCISTDPFLGVAAPDHARFFVICSPVGPYYAEGFKPVRLLVEENNVRAWRGGTGAYKLGCNYAPTVQPQLAVQPKGYAQVLWLADGLVTEVGAMNFFVLWKTKEGKTELITAPLDMGTILPGVTRDCILSICREWKEFDVTERPFHIDELAEAAREGRVLEAFGAGTAAIVSQVSCLGYRGVDLNIPAPNKSLALRLMDRILAIQYGEVEHEWSVKC
eukprot:TRINITY_DN3464_c0_g1_i1.p1 TRINITY_DN3464_c0_g1~~TRINITY_DN3464_c0_g1_i1.p1  ORF type:complete len:382 (+),score=71.05 TRINITY_DN3464_c0_g1_i1:31-1176(+)